MRRMACVLLMGLLAALARGPAPIRGQVVSVGEVQCDEGAATGDLGITGLDCRGECTLTMNERGGDRTWSFSLEPTVTGIGRHSPAYGVLRPGDALVAVDGMLITTPEGGRRYASIEPGEKVRIRFRRDGRVQEATLQAVGSCPPPPAPAPPAEVVVPGVARALPPPPPPGRADTAWTVTVLPRVRVTSAAVVAEPDSIRPSEVVTSAPARVRALASGGRLGIGMACGECRQVVDRQTGRSSWTFSGPIEVTGVEAGGPADEAGIQIGDLITGVDGHTLETPAGAAAFSNMAPGEPVRLTVLKRNGSRAEVTAIPEEASAVAVPLTEVTASSRVSRGGADTARVAAGAVVSARPPESARVARPAPPARVVSPGISPPPAPTGLPLRFTGSMGGAEVEIRGDPVTVTETETENGRVLLITSNGLWIRIRLPEEGGAPGAKDGPGR